MAATDPIRQRGRRTVSCVNSRRWMCLAGFALCLITGFAAAEEEDAADETEPTRILRGTDAKEASAARDQADRLRAAIEKRMPWFGKRLGEKAPATGPNPFAAEIAEVEEAYQGVIDKYPHTEIAAYCAMRLAGFYQFQGKYDDCAELLEKTAREFAGTREGARVALDTGLHHAQTRHDYVQAAKWFGRVPRPQDPDGPMNHTALRIYLSAQQQLMKCDLRLGRDNDAETRLSELKTAFPKHGDEFDRFYKFELLSRDGMPRTEKKKDQ